jgi:hypothetical protein
MKHDAGKVLHMILRKHLEYRHALSPRKRMLRGAVKRFFKSLSDHDSYHTGEVKMNAIKMLAIVLIVAGSVGLLYGKFSYTKETHNIQVGPLDMSVAEKETVNIPLWAGVAAILGGGVLLVYASKKD